MNQVLSKISADRYKRPALIVAQILTISATIMTIAVFVMVGPMIVTLFMLAAQGFIMLSILICLVVVVTTPERELIKEHFGRGAIIFRKGEIADKVYVIENGQVEAVEDEPGKQEKVIRNMGPGDHFGEIALIRRTTRTLTVRAATDVERRPTSTSSPLKRELSPRSSRTYLCSGTALRNWWSSA